MSIEQSHHKPVVMYDRHPLKLPLGGRCDKLREPPPYIMIGLWQDFSNETRFTKGWRQGGGCSCHVTLSNEWINQRIAQAFKIRKETNNSRVVNCPGKNNEGKFRQWLQRNYYRYAFTIKIEDLNSRKEAPVSIFRGIFFFHLKEIEKFCIYTEIEGF